MNLSEFIKQLQELEKHFPSYEVMIRGEEFGAHSPITSVKKTTQLVLGKDNTVRAIKSSVIELASGIYYLKKE